MYAAIYYSTFNNLIYGNLLQKLTGAILYCRYLKYIWLMTCEGMRQTIVFNINELI